MELITRVQFDKICTNYKTLVQAVQGPKLLHSDHEVIKIFYPRKKISSALFFPHALRFKTHSERLKNRDIATVSLTNIAYCADINTHLVYYDKIPGMDLRKAAKNDITILSQVASLTAELHEKGIFFRSIHLANLLLAENDHIALIDITDVRFRHHPLWLSERIRNLAHLLFHRHDYQYARQYGIQQFLTEYFAKTTLTAKQQQKITTKLQTMRCF